MTDSPPSASTSSTSSSSNSDSTSTTSSGDLTLPSTATIDDQKLNNNASKEANQKAEEEKSSSDKIDDKSTVEQPRRPKVEDEDGGPSLPSNLAVIDYSTTSISVASELPESSSSSSKTAAEQLNSNQTASKRPAESVSPSTDASRSSKRPKTEHSSNSSTSAAVDFSVQSGSSSSQQSSSFSSAITLTPVPSTSTSSSRSAQAGSSRNASSSSSSSSSSSVFNCPSSTSSFTYSGKQSKRRSQLLQQQQHRQLSPPSNHGRCLYFPGAYSSAGQLSSQLRRQCALNYCCHCQQPYLPPPPPPNRNALPAIEAGVSSRDLPSTSATADAVTVAGPLLPRGPSTSPSSSFSSFFRGRSPESLLELSARLVAEHIPYEYIEQRYSSIPEPVQRRVIFWSFPRDESYIRLYSSISSIFKAEVAAGASGGAGGPGGYSQQLNALAGGPGGVANNGLAGGYAGNHLPPSLSAAAANQVALSVAMSNYAAAAAASNSNGDYNGGIGGGGSLHQQSTSANSSVLETTSTSSLFNSGLLLLFSGAVHQVLQVGFNLSGVVTNALPYNPISSANGTNSSYFGDPRPSTSSSSSSSSMAAALIDNLVNPNVVGVNNPYNLGPEPYNNNRYSNALQSSAAAAAVAAAAVSSYLSGREPVGGLYSGNSGRSGSGGGKNNNNGNGNSPASSYLVSITFDRCKITSVTCTCNSRDHHLFWCEHVVALALYRIRKPLAIELRVPISESLLEFDRQQLQKLLQYLIAEHHVQILPTVQRLVDELAVKQSSINQIAGAPDPTAGACVYGRHDWYLNEEKINAQVRDLVKYVSVNEAKQILQLFCKIVEMLKIKDSNGPRFLRLITEQFLQSYSHFNKPDEASSAFDPYIFLWDHLTNLWIYIVVDAGLSPLKRAQWREMFHHWTTQLNCPREDTYFCLEVVDNSSGPMIVNGGNGFYHQSHSSGSSSSSAVLPSTSSDYHSSGSGEGSSYDQQYSNNGRSSSGNQRRSSSAYYNQNSYYQQGHHYGGNYGYSHHYGGSHHHLQGHHQPSTSSGSSSSRSYRRRRILERAYDATFLSWEDRHLKRILREDGPFLEHQGQNSEKHAYSYGEYYDMNGFPIWPEHLPTAATRVASLRVNGHQTEALRLAMAIVRYLTHAQTLKQKQYLRKGYADFEHAPPSESWIGSPLDPVGVLFDTLAEASLTPDSKSLEACYALVGYDKKMENGGGGGGLNLGAFYGGGHGGGNGSNSSSQSCRTLLAELFAGYTELNIPLVELQQQNRSANLQNPPSPPELASTSSAAETSVLPDRPKYRHVVVPGAVAMTDTYLSAAVTVAIIGLGQHRRAPDLDSQRDKTYRQEARLLRKLLDIRLDPTLVGVLTRQASLLLEIGLLSEVAVGEYCSSGSKTVVPFDIAQIPGLVRYLFGALVAAKESALAYDIGLRSLRFFSIKDESAVSRSQAERYGKFHRGIQYYYMDMQLMLAKTMLFAARSDPLQLQSIFATVKANVRSPLYLNKLAHEVFQYSLNGGLNGPGSSQSSGSGSNRHEHLLQTAYAFGLHLTTITLGDMTGGSSDRHNSSTTSSSSSNSSDSSRKPIIQWLVSCAAEINGLSVVHLLENWRSYFTPAEAVRYVASTVLSRDFSYRLCGPSSSLLVQQHNNGNGSNSRHFRPDELQAAARKLAVECALQDPASCAQNALNLCEKDPAAFDTISKVVEKAGALGQMSAHQLFNVARYMEHQGVSERACKLALLAASQVNIPLSADTHHLISELQWACSLAQGLGTAELTELVNILVKNVRCAPVLADMIRRCSYPLPTSSGGGVGHHSQQSLHAAHHHAASKHLMAQLHGSSGSSNQHQMLRAPPHSSSVYGGAFNGPPGDPLGIGGGSGGGVPGGNGFDSSPYALMGMSSAAAAAAAAAHHHHHLASVEDRLRLRSRGISGGSSSSTSFKTYPLDRQPLSTLLNAAVRAYIETVMKRLEHISPRHYSDFIEFLTRAQETIILAPDGQKEFASLLEKIKTLYKGKKKLMFLVKERFR